MGADGQQGSADTVDTPIGMVATGLPTHTTGVLTLTISATQID